MSSADKIQNIYKEGEALKALQHKNIVKLHHAFIEGKQFIMIMEAALGGELTSYFKPYGGKHDFMPESIARDIILQVI